jgi:biotin carboxylase
MTQGYAAIVEAQLNWQGLRWLAAARELGFEPLFVTSNVDRYREVHRFAEIFAQVEVVVADTNEAGEIEAALRPWASDGGLRILLSQCDYNVPVTAEVARRFGLPGPSPSAAATARNKLATREACRAAGVPCPAYQHVTSLDDAVAAGHKIGFPCVVKPMTESASTDVELCSSPDDLARRYSAITAEALDRRGQPRPQGVLVEEYCIGYEVSVETFTSASGTVALAVSDKSLGAHPFFVEIGDVLPSALPDEVTSVLSQTAIAALDAVGHDFGPAHTEVRMTAQGPRLIEVNARLGGADIPDLLEAAFGLRMYHETLRAFAGESPDLVPRHRRAAATRWFTAGTSGVVERIQGIDLARQAPGFVAAEFDVRPGDRVEAAVSNHELCGYVLADAATSSEALRRAETAANFVSIVIRPEESPT